MKIKSDILFKYICNHNKKFYGRLWSIRSVLGASKVSVLKLIEIVILWVYHTLHFDFSLFLSVLGITFATF